MKAETDNTEVRPFFWLVIMTCAFGLIFTVMVIYSHTALGKLVDLSSIF